MTKKRKIHLKTDRDGEPSSEDFKNEKKQKEPSEPPKESNLAVNIFHTAFMVLFVFYLFSGFTAYRSGAFSHVLFLTFALGGFLIAALSRRLAQSGYFLFYRILAVVFFVIIGGALYFVESLDGFLTALFCIMAASVVLGAFLPFVFKEIPVGRIALISGSLLAVGLVLMVMIGNRTEVRRKSTVSFPDKNYFAMVFDEKGEDCWVISDDWFFANAQGPGGEKPVNFTVMKREHPVKFLENKVRKEMEDLKNFSGGSHKKKDDKKTPDPAGDDGPLYTYQGKAFSWSFMPRGTLLAVAAVGEKSGQNKLFMLDLKERRRIDIDAGSDRVFFFPWKSRTYGDYSTWSPDGNSFFAFIKDGDKIKLLVADIKGEKKTELDRDDVLSAFWAEDGSLYLLCGSKRAPDHLKPDPARVKSVNEFNFGYFDFAPDKVELFVWKPGSVKTEKIQASFPDRIQAVKVHPASNRLMAFDGSKAFCFTGSEGFIESAFAFVPDAEESAVSPDGGKILLKNRGQVLLADVKTGSSTVLENTTRHIRHATFSADGKTVIYAECSDFSLWLFHCLFKVYRVEENRLAQFVPNFPTASVRASTSFPFAFYTDPFRNFLCFEQKSFKKQFFKEPVSSTNLWLLFPPVIEPPSEPSPAVSPELSPSPGATPSASPSVEDSPKVQETSSPAPFVGGSPLPSATP